VNGSQTARGPDRIRQLPSGVADPWSGLSPDDSPLVAQEMRTQDIYALDVDFP